MTAPGEFPFIVDMEFAIDRIAKKPNSKAFARGELIKVPGVVREARMDPERLTLGMVVLEDDDFFALAVKRVQQTRGGAIPRGDWRACGETLGVDVVVPGDELAEGSGVEVRLGSPRRRIRGAVGIVGPFMGARGGRAAPSVTLPRPDCGIDFGFGDMPAACRREVVKDAVNHVRGAIGGKESSEIEQEAMNTTTRDWRAWQHFFDDKRWQVAWSEVEVDHSGHEFP